MIRRLRVQHRVASVALAVFAPTILIAALVVRPGVVVSETAGPSAVLEGRGAPRTFRVHDVELSYWVEGDEGGRFLLVVADASLEAPDVLLYATAEPPTAGGGLPEDALFLAPLAGTTPAVAPLDALEGRGSFLLYSLPHQEVLGSAPL